MRYEPRRLEWDTRELTQDIKPFANGEQAEPWIIWDTELSVEVNKWGEPDPDYWAAHRDVAKMRAGDLNAERQYKEEAE